MSISPGKEVYAMKKSFSLTAKLNILITAILLIVSTVLIIISYGS